MLAPVHFPLLVATASLFDAAFGAAVAHIVARDGPAPSLPFDPNTSSSCVWWADLSSPTDCSSFLSESLLTLEQFRRWVSDP
jgi:hypothetical protein